MSPRGAEHPDRPGPHLPRPDLVIFDCDGVLVDTEPITLRVMRDWLAQCGWDLDLHTVTARFKGTHITQIERLLGDEAGVHVEGFVEGYRRRMYAAFEAGVPAIPGADRVLDALHAAGVRTCIASNGPHAKMDASLTRSGLALRLGGLRRDGGRRIFSADDVAHPKPAPDLFLHAARELGAKPAHCLVVEDSPSGVRAARAAGMPCVAFADITPPAALAAEGPDAVITALIDLLGLLGLP